MEITDIRVLKIKKRGALLGFANIVLNDCFAIKGIRIIETEKTGRFVSMPSKKIKNSKYPFRDVCHPINNETRLLITNAISDAYDKLEDTEE